MIERTGPREAGPGERSTDAAPGPRLTVLHAEEYRFPAPWRFPPTEIPYSIVRMVTSGGGVFTVDGDEYAMCAGDVAFVPEGKLLECRSSSADFAFISVRFTTSVSVNGRDLLAESLAIPVFHSSGEQSDLQRHCEAIVAAWERATPARNLFTAGHLHLVLGTLLERTRTDSHPRARKHARRAGGVQPRTHDLRMERVLDYLARVDRLTPDVKHLCALTHMSESTLRRSFKEHTGKTIGEYLRDLRMTAAARQLLLTDEAVSEIARGIGFHDANYFTRVFRQVFGMAPMSYRRLARQG